MNLLDAYDGAHSHNVKAGSVSISYHYHASARFTMSAQHFIIYSGNQLTHIILQQTTRVCELCEGDVCSVLGKWMCQFTAGVNGKVCIAIIIVSIPKCGLGMLFQFIPCYITYTYYLMFAHSMCWKERRKSVWTLNIEHIAK